MIDVDNYHKLKDTVCVYCKNCKHIKDVIRTKSWFERDKPMDRIDIPDYICTSPNNKTKYVRMMTWYEPEIQVGYKDHPKNINWHNRCEWYNEEKK